MEQPGCNLCGSLRYKVVYKKNIPHKDCLYRITDEEVGAHYRIVQCLCCALIYVNPLPKAALIEQQYRNFVDDEYLREEKGRRQTAQRVLKMVGRYVRSGTLLELGSATGFFLDEARKCGWQVCGVEPSTWGVRYARNKLTLDVFTSIDEMKDYRIQRFDVVILLDVLEHILKPKSYLEFIRKKLKPDGLLCISTPNIDSFISRLLKAKWWGINRSHLYYFSKKTICRMLDIAGFKVLKCYSYVRFFRMGYLLRRLHAYNSPFFFIFRAFLLIGLSEDFLMRINTRDQILVFARKARRLQFINEMQSQGNISKQRRKQKTIVVLPAYNAAKTLSVTLRDIPKDCVDEVLLVDDASIDNTIEVAERLGIPTIAHKKNLGYGANQKTCYSQALKRGADIVVMVHPDYQYDPRSIPELIAPIKEGRAQAVFGSRMMKGGALEGGMPMWKHNANILLTALENVVLGTYLTEYHSGFRAFSREYLQSVNFMDNSNGFVFDTEIIVQGILANMRFEEVPIRTRYFDEASTIALLPSIKYGLDILKTLCKYLLHKNKIIKFKQFII